MLEIMKFQAWLRALGLNLIIDESELRAQISKVEAQAFWAFEQLVRLCTKETIASIRKILHGTNKKISCNQKKTSLCQIV